MVGSVDFSVLNTKMSGFFYAKDKTKYVPKPNDRIIIVDYERNSWYTFEF